MMMSRGADFDFIVKVVVIGDSGVGKTSLLLRYSDDIYDDNYIATIGVDFRIQTMEKNGKIIKLQLWDTAGQERFRTITQGYYRGAHAVALCFDLTDAESFQHCVKWMKDIQTYAQPDCVLILIGNKADRVADRVVPAEEAERFAREYGMPYVETSAKKNHGVEECFVKVIDAVVGKRVAQISLSQKQPLRLQDTPRPRKRRSCFGFFMPF